MALDIPDEMVEQARQAIEAIEPRLVALIAAKALRDAADAMDADDPRDEGPRWTRVDLGYYGESEWLRARADHIEARR